MRKHSYQKVSPPLASPSSGLLEKPQSPGARSIKHLLLRQIAMLGLVLFGLTGLMAQSTNFESFTLGTVHYKGTGTTVNTGPPGNYTIPSPYGSLWTLADEWGFQKTGSPFDQEVKDDSGNKVWRLSNAVTSNSFSFQTCTPSTAQPAGETTAALYNDRGTNHTTPLNPPNARATASSQYFHAGFKFKSATGAAQTGLALSVSPTPRQSSVRMAFVGLVDNGSTGLNLTFAETLVGGTFSSTETIASNLSYTDWHRVDIYIQFVDGLNGDGTGNDIVTIMLDGDVIKTGTTWETFYASPSWTATPDPIAVDALMFRAGGTAAGGTAGNGLYFDNVQYDNEPLPKVKVYADAAETIYVNGYSTIQAAVSDASTLNGHYVRVAAGTYNEQISVSKQLTFRGPNAGNSAQGSTNRASRVTEAVLKNFIFNAACTLDGFSFEGSNSYNGEVAQLQIFVPNCTVKNTIFNGKIDSPFQVSGQNSLGILLGFNTNTGGLMVDGCYFVRFRTGVFANPCNPSATLTFQNSEFSSRTGINFDLGWTKILANISNNLFQVSTADGNPYGPVTALNFGEVNANSVLSIDGNTWETTFVGIDFKAIKTGTTSVSVTNNTFKNYGMVPSTGIFIVAESGTGASISNNFFTCTKGIQNKAGSISAGNSITNNSFTVAGATAIENLGTGTLPAECNWFGSAVEATVTSLITGSASYCPWLTNGTDDAPATSGFQPVSGSCTGAIGGMLVTNTNTGKTFCSIQSAISDATTLNGHTITVAAGTYAENLTINKSLDLRGPNYGISPNTGTRVGEATITGGINLDNAASKTVSVTGFQFTGVTSPLNYNGNAGGTIAAAITFRENIVSSSGQLAILLGTATNTASATIDDNSFLNMSANAMQLVAGTGTLNASITDNTINTTVNAGMNTDGLTNSTIDGNTISNTTQQGIQIAGPAANVTVSNNVITNANTSNGADRGGIRLYGTTFAGQVTISNNAISGSNNGIAVRNGEDITGKMITVTNNSLSGNLKTIYHGGTGALSAECNWFGATNTTAIAATLAGTGAAAVDFSPFLLTGVDNAPMTIGFQPADPCSGPDLVPPTAVCQDATVVLDDMGNATLAASLVNDGSSDNLTVPANLVLAVSPNAFDCTDEGDQSVTLTVTDEEGNTANCMATVTVLDVLYYSETPGLRTAIGGLAQDKMGWGLDLDGGVAIGGAPDDKVGTQNKQGSAFVFLQNQGGSNNWGALKQIRASDGLAVDYFGNAVSIDGSTAVVGAYGDNIGALTDAGSAYIYEKDLGGTNNWGQRKRISASDAAAYAYFGNAISLVGGRAIVGANKHKEGPAIARGAVYIFEKDQGGANNWGQTQKLLASDGAANNFFGASVGQVGNIALVGADGNLNNRGAVYVFDGGASWAQTQKLTASDAAIGDGFGASLSVSGNYAVIGAPNKATYTGAAYVFKNNAGTWSELKQLTASDGAINDRFGMAVDLEGDYAYISALRANGTAGAVYVFHRNAGGPDNWGQIGKYFAAAGAANDQFGYSVAASGDMLAVGANLCDLTGPTRVDAGAVYFFTGEDCPDVPKAPQATFAESRGLAETLSVKCSPNPFRDELAIEINATGAARLTVTDAAGRMMTNLELPAGLGRFTLETSAFRDGMYFVQVSSESGVRVLPVALVR